MPCGNSFRGSQFAYRSAGVLWESYTLPGMLSNICRDHFAVVPLPQCRAGEKMERQKAVCGSIDSWPDHPRFVAFRGLCLVSDRKPLLLDYFVESWKRRLASPSLGCAAPFSLYLSSFGRPKLAAMKTVHFLDDHRSFKKLEPLVSMTTHCAQFAWAGFDIRTAKLAESSTARNELRVGPLGT